MWEPGEGWEPRKEPGVGSPMEGGISSKNSSSASSSSSSAPPVKNLIRKMVAGSTIYDHRFSNYYMDLVSFIIGVVMVTFIITGIILNIA